MQKVLAMINAGFSETTTSWVTLRFQLVMHWTNGRCLQMHTPMIFRACTPRGIRNLAPGTVCYG